MVALQAWHRKDDLSMEDSASDDSARIATAPSGTAALPPAPLSVLHEEPAAAAAAVAVAAGAPLSPAAGKLTASLSVSRHEVRGRARAWARSQSRSLAVEGSVLCGELRSV